MFKECKLPDRNMSLDTTNHGDSSRQCSANGSSEDYKEFYTKLIQDLRIQTILKRLANK